jgi:ubiquinone/menaquinone biosynthesis C-methylase UbiE
MDKIKLAPSVFDKNALTYQEKFMDTSTYHDGFDVMLGKLPTNATVLDVACGPGNISAYLLSKRPGLDILGIDLSPVMLELAAKNCPPAKFQLTDIREIKKLNKTFDAVICGFGFPYLTKEEVIQFIADATSILNDNGVLYLSTMEDDYNNSGVQTASSGDKVFMYYHEAGYLTDALKANSLQLIETYRKEYVYNGKPTTDLVLIAGK